MTTAPVDNFTITDEREAKFLAFLEGVASELRRRSFAHRRPRSIRVSWWLCCEIRYLAHLSHGAVQEMYDPEHRVEIYAVRVVIEDHAEGYFWRFSD